MLVVRRRTLYMYKTSTPTHTSIRYRVRIIRISDVDHLITASTKPNFLQIQLNLPGCTNLF